MKIKVASSDGKVLEWLVARCEGFPLTAFDFLQYYNILTHHYATSWAQGGPIIEREKISVIQYFGEWRGTKGSHVVEEAYSFELGTEACEFGETPLIAAMRCYTASKLGDEVDIPDELMEVS